MTRVIVKVLVACSVAVAAFSFASQRSIPTTMSVAAEVPLQSELETGIELEAADGERGRSPLDPNGAQTLSAPKVGTVKPVVARVNVSVLGRVSAQRIPERPERGDPVSSTNLAPTGTTTAVPVGVSATATPGPSGGWAGLPYQEVTGTGTTRWGCGYPPDTNGDVGPLHYVQSVNCSVGMWTKADGIRRAAFTFNEFFPDTSNTPCDNNNYGDPVVVYDTFAARWIITDFAFTTDTSGNLTSATYECVAVSPGSDPTVTADWRFFAIAVSNVGDIADYPKVGMWPSGIFITFNMFSTRGFKNVRAIALNRDDLYGTGTTPVKVISFDLPQTSGGSTVFSLLPSNARLQTGEPPAGRPNLLASIYGSYAVRVWNFSPNWTTLSSSTLTGPTNASTGTFRVGPSTAPTTANANDTLTYRLMMQNQYTSLGSSSPAKESLWLTHTVGVSKVAAPAWYEVNVNGGTVSTTLRQRGVYAPGDGVHRYMPSLAVDRLGDMAVGYTASKSGMNPAIRYAGRMVGDTAGTLGAEATMFAGGGSQTYTQRWGDYSAMSLDPADGCTFWFTSEVYNETGRNWQTRIGSFKLCP